MEIFLEGFVCLSLKVSSFELIWKAELPSKTIISVWFGTADQVLLMDHIIVQR